MSFMIQTTSFSLSVFGFGFYGLYGSEKECIIPDVPSMVHVNNNHIVALGVPHTLIRLTKCPFQVSVIILKGKLIINSYVAFMSQS